MAIDVLYVLFSYVVGAVPVIHILAKRRGVDLRAVGTRNVGATNLWENAGPVVGTIGSVLDLVKGAIPPLGALTLGLGQETAALSGLTAVAGQMWPVFLGFRGGRGNLTGSGALAVVVPGVLAIGAVPVIVGIVSKWGQQALGVGRPGIFGVALGVFVGLLTIVVSVWTSEYPPVVQWSVTALAGLVLMRRLTADLRLDMAAPPEERPGILGMRILLDRPKR